MCGLFPFLYSLSFHWHPLCTVEWASIEAACLLLQDGDSALISAAYIGKTEVVGELVKRGADLTLQNKVCIISHVSLVAEDGMIGHALI